MSDLIVKAVVKDALSDQNVSAGFYDSLDEVVSVIRENVVRRADANDWRTVKPRGL